ncbi:hypothetical protein GCM10010869_08180 [Mesorhizobium tianshanense]|uniref:Uncharacterized protein n=1 Tax=Mesorhizobium tianshanense TaxID=39844 RepID=A0A562NBR3_9HYPH|nr:hypothetical protein [Mesorhizobium tianshanense]TWI29632.1 hypothetical protein IQ26_05055 [Mesorhizobium tianshanense]GLS35230.1 hypothetical protein GCM10010869_08180 [Mesorhizobium tianshanense]
MITLIGSSDEVKVAAAILPATIFGDVGAWQGHWEDLAPRKSFVTANARQITQAIVGAPEQIRTSVTDHVGRRLGRELPSLVGELLEG